MGRTRLSDSSLKAVAVLSPEITGICRRIGVNNYEGDQGESNANTAYAALSVILYFQFNYQLTASGEIFQIIGEMH